MIKARKRLTARTYSTAGALIAIAAAAATILGSPYVLSKVSSASADWRRLSDIGQSYGAAGAVFSGLAFIGVTFTLFTLNRQAAFQQALSLRSMHFDVLRTAIDHPDYERAMQEDRDDGSLALWAYFNLRLQTIYFFWRSGEVDDDNAAAEIGLLMKKGLFRDWWNDEGSPLWNAGRQTISERRFVSLVEAAKKVEHEQSLAAPATRPSTSSESGAGKPCRLLNTGVALLVGIAIGATVSAISAPSKGAAAAIKTGRIPRC